MKINIACKQTLTKLKWGICVLALGASYSGAINADDRVYAADLNYFGIDDDGFRQISVIPARMMDNDTLFRAAETERNNPHCISQRLMNNRWLATTDRNSYEGTEALRKYLRINLLTVWKDRNPGKTRVSSEPKSRYESSQFQEIDNYRLSISEDRVKLRFKYKFD